MRVGIVCPYSITVPGGVQEQVLGLARALRAAGHPARVLAPADGPPPDGWVTPLGDSIPTAANGSVAPLAPDPSAQLRLIRAVRDEGFDVLHLHEPLVPGPTMTACLLKPTPLVGTFHAAGTSASYRYFGAPLRWMVSRLDARVVVSSEAEALARDHLGGTYEHLFNGIEIARYRDVEPWPTDGPTVLFCGRHEPRKGLDVFLGALSVLGEDVRVWVGGSGPDTARLQRAHAGDPRIEWLGQLSDEEKRRRMRGADVFCAPSLRGESFGVVLLEAMAADCAVVAGDLSGYRLVVRDGRDGVLVPPGDVEALGGELHRALTDRPWRDALVASAAERVREFSMDRLAAAYLDIYERITEAAPQPKGSRRPGRPLSEGRRPRRPGRLLAGRPPLDGG